MMRIISATALAVLVCLGAAPGAWADSVTIDAVTTNGQSDLVAGVPRIFHVKGHSNVRTGLFITYRHLGGPPCEANVEQDRGSWYREYGDHGYNAEDPRVVVDGDFDRQDVFVWDEAGTFTFC